MSLDQCGAVGRSEVAEKRRKAVVQVGVDDDLARVGGEQGQRLDGRRRGRHVIAPARQAKGEVLSQVADGRRAGAERGQAILHRGRHAEHEVAEMGGDRRLGGERRPAFCVGQYQAGSLRPTLALRGRIAHGPVETDAIAVEGSSGIGHSIVNLAPGAAARRRIAVADLGVQHQPPVAHAAALVVGLGGHLRLAQESTAPQFRRRGACAGPVDQLGLIGQPALRQDFLAVGQVRHISVLFDR